MLVEAVTNHGPIEPKRRNELKTLFKGAKAGLVFVTAFLARKAMVKYLDEMPSRPITLASSGLPHI